MTVYMSNGEGRLRLQKAKSKKWKGNPNLMREIISGVQVEIVKKWRLNWPNIYTTSRQKLVSKAA